jgi:hypothetical protein
VNDCQLIVSNTKALSMVVRCASNFCAWQLNVEPSTSGNVTSSHSAITFAPQLGRLLSGRLHNVSLVLTLTMKTKMMMTVTMKMMMMMMMMIMMMLSETWAAYDNEHDGHR